MLVLPQLILRRHRCGLFRRRRLQASVLVVLLFQILTYICNTDLSYIHMYLFIFYCILCTQTRGGSACHRKVGLRLRRLPASVWTGAHKTSNLLFTNNFLLIFVCIHIRILINSLVNCLHPSVTLYIHMYVRIYRTYIYMNTDCV